MSVRLIYKDVAVGADEDATVAASVESEPFSDVSKIPYGVEASAIATGELNGWGLIHDYKVFDNQPIAFWSKERSGEDCVFSTPPTITLGFSQPYTVSGLTVRFAPGTMDYCSQMSAIFYQDGAIIHNGTYYPDSPDFVIADVAEAFDKLELIFEKTNLPRKRLKIEHIIMGVIREFGGDELTGAEFIHEIDLISDTVPINVLDASFHSNANIDYVFQRKQPVEGYNGNELIGVYYIENGKRTGAQDYSISCCDLLGVWDKESYPGVVWTKDTHIRKALTHIFDDDIELFDIAPELEDAHVRGYIEPGTKRVALQHIAFALGAVVDTSGTKKVRLYPAPAEQAGAIPTRDIYIGGSVEVEDKITDFELTYYDITKEALGENDEYIELHGEQFKCVPETISLRNPDAMENDPPRKISYSGCYLVNPDNFWLVRDRIMEYHRRRNTYSFKHVLRGQKLGENHTATLPWGEEATGHITKMSISVTGITVSDTEMLLD